MSWFEDAACRGTDPAPFYPYRGESSAEAIAICGTCSVREECLEWALSHHEMDGVWGGLTAAERHHLTRTVRCLGCDAPFEAVNRNRYCSDRCRARARADSSARHRLWAS